VDTVLTLLASKISVHAPRGRPCTKSAVAYETPATNAKKTQNKHKSANMSSARTSSNRGGPCRFLWGTHYGKKAWFNKKGASSKGKYAVITLEEDGSYKNRSGFKHMIAKGHHRSAGVGEGREEKAFDKIPELEQNTSGLCTMLAQCNIKPSDKLTAMINERLEKANERQKIARGPRRVGTKSRTNPPTNATTTK
jgi:hypothetical protein